MRKVVGYPVENFSHSADVMVSIDENGPLELWRDIRPEETCDVGRTLEGEIVWIKKSFSPPPKMFTEALIPVKNSQVTNHTPQHEVTAAKTDLSHEFHNSWKLIRHRLSEIVNFLKKRKMVVIFVSVASLLLVLLWGGMPLAQPETTPQPALSEGGRDSIEAEDWVRRQILDGQVPEIVLDQNATVDDIVTTPVSSAGGALLMDVSYPSLEGVKTVTLLLQKTPDSWRLRHVYDQKS